MVSSFSSKDVDPERSDAAGVVLLRQYLQYVESNGTNLGDQVVAKPPLNPFEVDVSPIGQMQPPKIRGGFKQSAQRARRTSLTA